MSAIWNLLKIIPSIVGIFKGIASLYRKLKYKWKNRKIDKAIDKAEKEKNVEDLKKEIDDLLD